jgi:hypothetical protein
MKRQGSKKRRQTSGDRPVTESPPLGRLLVTDRPASPFAPLRPLLQPDERDAAEGLHKLSAALRGFDKPISLYVRMLDGSAVEHWTIESGGRKPSVQRRAPKTADVMIVLRQETWLQIAQGRLSPFDALLAGRLRVGGDTALAKRLAQHLSDPAVPFVALC